MKAIIVFTVVALTLWTFFFIYIPIVAKSCKLEKYLRSLDRGRPMAAPIMKYFEFAHLPPKLQDISRPIAELAAQMDTTLPDGPEKSAGLRKLLEAKDCFVRANL